MSTKYPFSVMLIHCLTFFAVLIAYFSSGNPTVHQFTGEIHVFFGVSVFLLSCLRIFIVYMYHQDLPVNKPFNKYQNFLFFLVKYTLYLCMFLTPFLGWLALSSFTDRYQLFGVNFPLMNILDIENIGEIHQFLGNFFMIIIGLHASAALLHHYVLKDNVLKSMFYFKK